MKTRKEKLKRERVPRRALRRSPSFRRTISRAWDVENPPITYYQALEETYSKLPDGPIARKRPLHALFRGAATLAAACAALCIILIGINATEPELIEGLPGVGVLFRQFNENRWQDTLPPVSVKGKSTDVLPVTDNGTVLQQIEVDGTTLKLTATVPYMGRKSYLPICYYDATPLGTYGVLNGKRLVEGESYTSFEAEFSPARVEIHGETEASEDAPGRSEYFLEENLTEGDITATWTFTNVDMNQEQVVFTLFDWDGKLADSGVSLKEPRVTAEFVIDMKNRRACSSDNYQNHGRKKVTPEECRNMLETMAAEYAEGWHVGNMEPVPVGGDNVVYRRIDLFCAEEGQDGALPWPYVNLLCFSEGKTLPNRTIAMVMESVTSLERDRLLDMQEAEGALNWNAAADGFYVAGEETDPVRTGKLYYHFAVVLPVKVLSGKVGLGEDTILYGVEGRFSLRDGLTGYVLAEDLEESFRQDRERLTQIYSDKQSSVEESSHTVEWPWE